MKFLNFLILLFIFTFHAAQGAPEYPTNIDQWPKITYARLAFSQEILTAAERLSECELWDELMILKIKSELVDNDNETESKNERRIIQAIDPNQSLSYSSIIHILKALKILTSLGFERLFSIYDNKELKIVTIGGIPICGGYWETKPLVEDLVRQYTSIHKVASPAA